MSLIPITQEDVENVTLVLHPMRTIVSSSAGVTGTINLIDRPSSFNKKIDEDNPVNVQYKDDQISDLLLMASENFNAGSTDVSGLLDAYLKSVNLKPQIDRNTITFPPTRYVQPTKFNDDYTGSPYLMKRVITENIMPFYRHGSSFCDFSCGNYHTLNFLFSKDLPTNTALVYANTSSIGKPYTDTVDFTVDFYINPRYKATSGSSFTPGTILHISSSFALSLVTGSSKDENQQTDGFRLLLQLRQSADTRPTKISIPAVETGLTFPNDLIFVTPDNSLKYNNWHHVSVRWGGPSRSYGSGSITIDGAKTYFAVPSASIMNSLGPEAIVLGNYYDGSDNIGKFFNTNVAGPEGIPTIPGYSTDPTGFTFGNPLQAEIHDVKMFNRFLSDAEVESIESKADSSIPGMTFYVPPLFSTDTNLHTTLVSPHYTSNKRTFSPFNIDLALGVNGFYMNLENFVKDYVTKQFPRLYNLTGSTTTSTSYATANDFLYDNPKIVKRNLSIMPNDNGRQIPDFSLIRNESSDFFKNDLGNVDHGIISLRNVASTSSYFEGLPPDFSSLVGARPDDLYDAPGTALAIAQYFKDSSSNMVTIFDVSTLGFGSKIQPGSLKLVDDKLKGSTEKISITLVDDGSGALYRADCLTPHAKWNYVGNVFYQEGVILITNPSIFFLGNDGYSLSFSGEQRINVFIVNAMSPASLINSSSNPSYEEFPITDYVNEREKKFVYITGINLHDENLNVIMRANLAQPVAKRNSDEFMFRLKYDF
jgi:hypothetical protein